MHARLASAVGVQGIPGAQVDVVPSPKLHRAEEGRAVTLTVTPPTVAVPLSCSQFGIQNQLARLTTWSPLGLDSISGSGMVIRFSTPAATAAGTSRRP
mgnify:CR=1 FL=1